MLKGLSNFSVFVTVVSHFTLTPYFIYAGLPIIICYLLVIFSSTTMCVDLVCALQHD